jgi:hypothetical protein
LATGLRWLEVQFQQFGVLWIVVTAEVDCWLEMLAIPVAANDVFAVRLDWRLRVSIAGC